MNRARLVALVPIVVGIVSVACNGRVATDDSGSTSSKQKGADAPKDEAPASSSAPARGKPAQDPPKEPACDYEYQSSSSSGDPPLYYSCESKDNYTCGGAPKDITCSCSGSHGAWSKGSCSCNGITFEFDCANACSPGAAEYAKCGLPLPDDFGGAGTSGGSSSSSSGG